MPVNENDIDLIARYLEGSLTDDEILVFESKVASSKDFDEELSFQKGMIAHIKAEERIKLKAEMLRDFRRVNSEKKRNFFTKPVWYTIAASLLLISVFYFILNQKPSSGEIFSSYYQAYDGVVITRGDDNSITEGLLLYNDKKFSEALDIFLLVKDYEITEGQYYLLIANCYLELGQPEEALKFLNLVQEVQKTTLSQNRDWFVALTLIKLKRIPDAKTLLTRVIDSNGIYASKAKLLLAESIFE